MHVSPMTAAGPVGPPVPYPFHAMPGRLQVPIGRREEWLNAAAKRLAYVIQVRCAQALADPTTHAKIRKSLPARVRVPEVQVSVGFPESRSGPGHAIGQCWHSGCAQDSRCHIFVAPSLLSDGSPQDVLSVLIHELIHATVGIEAGHKGPFVAVARVCDLEGPATATVAGPELRAVLATVERLCGPYPHGALLPGMRRGPGGWLPPLGPGVPIPPQAPPREGRMRKLVCQCPEPKILRASRAVVDRGGIGCADCGQDFTEPQ